MAEPSLYWRTLAGRDALYNAYLMAGKGTPFLYPWDSLPVLYLFLGIMIRPHLSRSLAQLSGYLTFAAVTGHSAYIMAYRRSLGFAGGYGIGLIYTWGVIMTGVLLVLHEPERDFVRLELREAAAATTYTQTPEGVSYSVGNGDDQKKPLKSRHKQDFTQSFVPKANTQSKPAAKYRLIWQPFPNELLHSIDWTIDLMTSFRGPNWNFRIPVFNKIQTLPLPPGYKVARTIEPTMLANEGHDPSKPSGTLIRQSLRHTAFLYVATDVAKSLMVTDPYFLGLRPLDSPTPWPYLNSTPQLLQLTRLVIALTAIITCLSLIFSLGPLTFHALLPHLLPEPTLIHLTKSPLYSARIMYAPQFLPMLPTVVPAKGLAGLWGQSWHQMFRHGITEPSVALLRALSVPPRSEPARAVQLFVAFALSGALHAFASATTLSVVPSRPWDPWFFFVLQAVGITVQTWSSRLLLKTLKVPAPAWAKKTVNTLFTAWWLWMTGPLLADDFARCGIWLFEPLPVSFIRGVTRGEWWCWGGTWIGWWGSSVRIF